MNDGWVKIHRKMANWQWYHISEMVHLFMHLILSANHDDGHCRGIKVSRGQLLTGRKRLFQETGISEQTIRTCLNRLKSTNEITIESTSDYSIITVCNYDAYNLPTEEINQQINQPSNQQLTSNQPATNQRLTTNKNDKNDKKNKNTNTHSVGFDFEKRCFIGISETDLQQWGEAYPAVDIPTDIKRAALWLLDNPTKTKNFTTAS